MTVRIKKLLICALILLCGISALTACSLGTTVEKEKDKYGLTAQVTYHANGGSFSTNTAEATIYYKEGSKALDVGTVPLKSGTLSVKNPNHTLGGWYYAETDEEGNILYVDEENGIVEIGEKVDFSVALKSGDAWDVYADWRVDQKLEVLLAADESLGEGIAYGDTVYKPGDVLKEFEFSSGGTVEQPSNDMITGKREDGPAGYVRAGYYEDEACTKAVDWPVRESEGEENVKIYVKYLTDDWTVVSTAAGVCDMLTNTSAEYKYYISDDIDCNGAEALTLPVNGEFSGVIRGNGHTVSNLKISNTALARNSTVSLFGRIKSGASISDLTMKDVTMELSSANNAPIFAYFISSGTEEGATVKNITVDGGEMSVRLLGTGSRLNGARPQTGDACPVVAGNPEDYGVSVKVEPVLTIK